MSTREGNAITPTDTVPADGTPAPRFRMYEPRDRESIFRLWTDFIAPSRLERRKVLFDWLLRNPALEGESPYHVVTVDDQLVAHYGRMPIRFRVRGRPVRAYVCHDIYVDRRHRGRDTGLSTRLVADLRERAEGFILALWFAPLNLGLHRRCGWTELDGFRTQVRVLEPAAFLDRLPSAVQRPIGSLTRAAWNVVDRVAMRSKVRVEEIGHFDDRFDALAAEVAGGFPVIAERDARYLEWKYGKHPFASYVVRAALEGDRLRGYVVFRVDRSPEGVKGLIVDVLCPADRPDIFRRLVAGAANTMAREGAAYIVCVTTHPPFRGVLRNLGFLQARRPTAVMLADWDKAGSDEPMPSIDGWYLTKGDGDGDFWTMESES